MGRGMSNDRNEEWKTQFRAQMATARRRGVQHARCLIARVCPDLLCAADAEEVVEDALGDIWAGQVGWDHAAVGLARAIRDVVRYRIRDLAQRASMHVALPSARTDDEAPADAFAAEPHEALGTMDPRDALEWSDHANRLVEALRMGIADPIVAKLLDALIEGMHKPWLLAPAQLAASIGVSVAQLDSVRRRLARYAATLPGELRLAPEDAQIVQRRIA
jgi:hypothetical protein